MEAAVLWRLYRDYRVMLGLCGDEGKENGNYYDGSYRV